MSPATTEVTCRSLSSVTFTMKSQPAMRAIWVFSSWTGLPSRMPQSALWVLEQLGPMPALDRLERRHSRANQLPASGIPGHQVRLDQARRNLQVRHSHSGCRSTPGIPRDVVPTNVCSSKPRAEVVFNSITRHDLRARASPAFQPRCWGGATRSRPESTCDLAESPPRASTRSIGPRIVWFGTGRVISQIKMHASLRPSASLRKGSSRSVPQAPRRRPPWDHQAEEPA